MQDEISINQMSISDRDAVLLFLKSAFPDNPRQSDERFWNWHFLENPNNSKGQIPVCLARASGSILGQLAALPVQLNIGGRAVSAIWVIDIIISPEFRRRGIMKRLIHAA